jgi:mono/diheme cytochrome c family protein
VPLAGCFDQAPGKPDPANRPIRPSEVRNFDALFGQKCAGCHGKDGKGQPAPPLNDRIFLASLAPVDEAAEQKLSAEQRDEAAKKRDEKKRSILSGIIRDGRKGSLMPAFGDSSGGSLTNEQVAILADGIVKRWGEPPATKAPIPPYQAPDVAGNADHGRILFSMACAGCHGKNGEGASMAGALHNPSFLALLSKQALRRFIITGRPDLKKKMPDFADPDGRNYGEEDFTPLTSQQVANLVAYLETWRKGDGVSKEKPAGPPGGGR